MSEGAPRISPAEQAKTRQPEPNRTFALVGNPNSGKTTLFNALTGLKQKVGNYPGVTVERKEGYCYGQHGETFRILDLPGAYSLNARSPDEAILRDVLLGRRKDTQRPDAVICVLDASNPERNLYLATQVLDLGLPAILVWNMVDVAERRDIRIDLEVFREKLGIPVLALQAHAGKGLIELKIEMSKTPLARPIYQTPLPEDLRLPTPERPSLDPCIALRPGDMVRQWERLYLLSEHEPEHFGLGEAEQRALEKERTRLREALPDWEDELISERYAVIHGVCEEGIRHPNTQPRTLTDKLDAVLLHSVWGWVCLFGFMSLLFLMVFSLANIPMGWIESLFGSIGDWVRAHMAEGELRDLITEGMIAGMEGVVIFLPQILILFFFIGLLEGTGYMARVAFMMDRYMSRVGLNGRSFVPLLSSYACAIPGVMAARTVENPKDRLITILVAPLASCSARLPVYLVMIATLVQTDVVPLLTKVLFMIALYGLGTGGMFFFAWLFKKVLMKGESAPLILELPSYKMPSFKSILIHMWERSRIFLRRAGTIILGISILLWFLTNHPKNEGLPPSDQLAQSYAGRAGKLIEPVIAPLGYDWKVGIGLIASFAAREVFVSAMSIVYQVEGGEDAESGEIREALAAARRPDGSPVFSPLTCMSLLVFYVFAMQCISTIAIVRRETNGWKWPLFQVAYLTGTAWVAALVVYQVGKLAGFQ